MRVLVTGGAGFIGSNIVDRLIEDNHEVIIVDNLSTGKQENINSSAKFYNLDIRSKEFSEIFYNRGIDYVIHHAAQVDVHSSLNNPIQDANVNILGTINVLESCVQFGVKKVIYASSAAVYGNPHYLGIDEEHPISPVSFYGISKHTPEHYFEAFSKLYGLNYTILRYANVYGTRQDPKGEGGVISIFIDKLLKGSSPYIYGQGNQTRDFIYVKDVATANIRALHKGNNAIFNIGCNTRTSINQLLEMINKIMGTDIPAIYKDTRPGEIIHSFFDNAKARSLLEWNPEYDLYSGLIETIKYYKLVTK
jgi:UDP-glucose 4-epimerase